MFQSILGRAILLFCIVATVSSAVETEEAVEYGVDVSFPMHRGVSTNYPWLPHNVDPENNPVPKEYEGMALQVLGDKSKAYDEFMAGCRKHYGTQGRACDSTENARLQMTLHQPSSMVNYTDLGFKKIRAPESVFKLIKQFWDTNRDSTSAEHWPSGNTYTNHWVNPTEMVSVENTRLRGGGGGIKKAIWDAAQETMEEWVGEELTPCSLYGIRIYKEGAVLAPHVDRMPLVTSAIINVDQDTDEPWPIEVIGHDGKAYNVTMEPGDMVLYESHSVVHGRTYPLKGRFYANLFVHFEPTGHTLRHHGMDLSNQDDVNAKYKKDVGNNVGGHEHDTGMPAYIVEGSDEGKSWHRRHPGKSGHETRSRRPDKFSTGSNNALMMAQMGDAKALARLAKRDKKALHKKDENGWFPIHEGARAGSVEVLEILLKNGASVNERTNEGTGGSPLYLSEMIWGKDHAVSKFLQEHGGTNIEPEL